MGNQIPLQMEQFLRSILLGASLALIYDLTRALRRCGGRLWEAVLDIAVSITAVGSLFFFFMGEEGELRLFILLGAVGGAVLFFSLCSAFFRPIWQLWVEIIRFPLHLGYIFLKKLQLFSKKVFSFCKRWFTIIFTPRSTSDGEEREHGTQAFQIEDSP